MLAEDAKSHCTSVLLLEVISLAFQLDVNVLAINKIQLKTFQGIFFVSCYFYYKSCNCKQANLFVFFHSECRAALGTSSVFEQGSLLHQVSVVSSSSNLFLSLFLFVFKAGFH